MMVINDPVIYYTIFFFFLIIRIFFICLKLEFLIFIGDLCFNLIYSFLCHCICMHKNSQFTTITEKQEEGNKRPTRATNYVPLELNLKRVHIQLNHRIKSLK